MVHSPAHDLFSIGHFLCRVRVVDCCDLRNGAERQWITVATISGNFFLLKLLLAGTTTFMHRYGPNDAYPCVFSMKRTTYPYLLADFYDAHYNSDPVISLFGNMQIMFQYIKYDEKKKEIWPSPMTKPPIPTENSKGQHTQTPPKTSITQRLRTDLGRPVGVTSNPTGVVKPVYGIPITYQNGILDHWGERCSILDLLFWKGVVVAIFKLSYSYMKVISLKNVMEKIINDIITLFLFNILKLLWPNFVHLSYFPTSTSVLNGLVSHIWEQLYINLRKIRFNIFYFSSYLCFILLYFMSYVKYWSKVAVDLEFWKYNTFCLLTHI